jgi:hypothetical protein
MHLFPNLLNYDSVLQSVEETWAFHTTFPRTKRIPVEVRDPKRRRGGNARQQCRSLVTRCTKGKRTLQHEVVKVAEFYSGVKSPSTHLELPGFKHFHYLNKFHGKWPS